MCALEISPVMTEEDRTVLFCKPTFAGTTCISPPGSRAHSLDGEGGWGRKLIRVGPKAEPDPLWALDSLQDAKLLAHRSLNLQL